MTRFALRGLLGRKLRTTLTAIAIVLGVAMVSGTYVLTDSIDQAFDSIFTDVRKGSNAVDHREGRIRPVGWQRRRGADVRRVAAPAGPGSCPRRPGAMAASAARHS